MELITVTREQMATANLALMMRGWEESAERERQKRGKKKVRRKKTGKFYHRRRAP